MPLSIFIHKHTAHPAVLMHYVHWKSCGQTFTKNTLSYSTEFREWARGHRVAPRRLQLAKECLCNVWQSGCKIGMGA